MYSEEDFLQLSALQHFVFCPRQCALSYIEQIWIENLLTAEGGIICFGQVSVSPFLMGFCVENNVTISFLKSRPTRARTYL